MNLKITNLKSEKLVSPSKSSTAMKLPGQCWLAKTSNCLILMVKIGTHAT